MKQRYHFYWSAYFSLSLCVFFILLLFSQKKSYAQSLTPTFDVCPLTDVPYNSVNLTGASSYRWDFCTGDLLRTPSAVLITDFIDDANTAGFDAWSPEGMTLAYDNGNWFGFITNLTGKNLIRVEFGNSLNNPPSYTNLPVSTIGGSNLYENPRKIRLAKDISGNWFGFINNGAVENSTSGIGGSVIKLSFGNSLSNTPTASILISGTGWNGPHALEIVSDEGILKLIVVSYPLGGALTRFNVFDFGNSFNNNPTLTQTSFPRFTTWGVAPIKQNGTWYLLTFDRDPNGRVRLLNFGNNLSNTPTIEKTYTITPPFRASYDAKLLRDGKNWVAFTLNDNGNLLRFNFGSNILNEPILTNLGNFGLLGIQAPGSRPSLTFTMAKDNSEWFLFAVNRDPNNVPPFNVNQVVRLSFPDICNVLPSSTSTESNPTIQYLSQAEGTNYTNLEVLDAGGNPIGTFVDSVSVTQAVTGDFVLENQNDCEDLLQAQIGRLGACDGEALRFFNTSFGLNSEITQTWNFGDNTTSSEVNPQHTYSQSGLYQVMLTTNNPNSACDNTITKEVRLSPPPIADFRVRSIDCETGKVVFEDFSKVPDEDAALGGFLTRRTWFFGDAAVPSFEAGRDDLDRNNVIIRGTQTVGEGGQAQQMPAYTPANSYQVTLVVGNDVCCTSSITRTISLNAEDIEANFSSSSACVGAPTQFTDLSTLAASIAGDIEQWEWTFTAPSGNIETNFLQNPSITFTEEGMYEVKLKVNSQFTCSKEITQNIEVLPSTTSNFSASTTIGIAPLTVQFTNLSSDNAVTYEWNFGDGNTSQTENPTYTFNNVGTYLVTLQARGSNGCGTLIQREIRVVEDPTSLIDNNLSSIRLFPNPNQGEFFVESTASTINEVNLTIKDTKGNVVAKSQLTSLADRQKVILPSYLPAGMYFVEIQAGKQSIVKKIIKQ